MKRLIAYFFIVVEVVRFTRPAFAIDQVHDEIQVYNAEIAEVGQWTSSAPQLRLYRANCSRISLADSSRNSLNGTPEFAYGITDWWELGFYAPFAVDSGGQFLSDGAKIRNLFVVPTLPSAISSTA